MAEAASNILRAELGAALAANTVRLCDGLRAELARDVTIEQGRRLQFEVDPWSWGITSCSTEELVIGADWLTKALPDDWLERAEEAGINWDALFSDMVCPWFADGWQEVGGPKRFSPAYLFIHDYHQQQYDLENHHWVPAEVAFEE